jgi:hypothetical protein
VFELSLLFFNTVAAARPISTAAVCDPCPSQARAPATAFRLPTPHLTSCETILHASATCPMLRTPTLRVLLLHSRPAYTCISTTLNISSCALRTMSTKPSLEAAEDFLSFVNASPTRMCATSKRCAYRCGLTSNYSFSCCQVSQT